VVVAVEEALDVAPDRLFQRREAAIVAGTLQPADVLFNAANNGIGASDFHDKASMFGPEVTQALNTAMAAMKAGTLKTCPDTGCGDATVALP